MQKKVKIPPLSCQPPRVFLFLMWPCLQRADRISLRRVQEEKRGERGGERGRRRAGVLILPLFRVRVWGRGQVGGVGDGLQRRVYCLVSHRISHQRVILTPPHLPLALSPLISLPSSLSPLSSLRPHKTLRQGGNIGRQCGPI